MTVAEARRRAWILTGDQACSLYAGKLRLAACIASSGVGHPPKAARLVRLCEGIAGAVYASGHLHCVRQLLFKVFLPSVGIGLPGDLTPCRPPPLTPTDSSGEFGFPRFWRQGIPSPAATPVPGAVRARAAGGWDGQLLRPEQASAPATGTPVKDGLGEDVHIGVLKDDVKEMKEMLRQVLVAVRPGPGERLIGEACSSTWGDDLSARGRPSGEQ